MILKWIDTKTVLLVGKKRYHAGDIVPDGSLSDERIELFISLKQLEKVADEEKPTVKPRKKAVKKSDDVVEETEDNAGPKE